LFIRFPIRFFPVVRVLEMACVGALALGATSSPTRAQITTLPAAVNVSSLRLQLDNEEPTFVYSERNTLRTQTPIAWGLRTWNDLNVERKVVLSWRVSDAFGKVLDRGSEKLTLPPNGMVRRRELFEPQRLGAYRIDVEARAQRKGADEKTQATFSFAIVASPAPFSNATSPLSRPFFDLASRPPRAVNEDSFLRRVGVNDTNLSSTQLPADMTTTLPYPQGLRDDGNAQGTGEGANWNRTLLAAQKVSPVFVVRDNVPAGTSAIRAAASLVKCGVLAKAAGATAVNTRLPSPTSDVDTRLTCAASWSQMARLLEGATPEGALYPSSPVVQGSGFRIGSSRIAVLWSDGDNESSTRLVARLAGARVFDLFGNEIAHSDGDKLVVPLSSRPVYVLADVSRAQSQRAWQSAVLKDLPVLGVQILPFTRSVSSDSAKDLAVRVRVQNIGIVPFKGNFRVAPPKGWTLSISRDQLQLAPGETRVLSFPVLTATSNTEGAYPIVTEASGKAGGGKWRQNARVATIERVANNAINLDGTLNEWGNASWMEADSPVARAQVALFFDDTNVYVACRVRELQLQVRPESTDEYSFWEGGDALQLAFGMRDESDSRPAAGAFRDTDYGLLLSPFATSGEGQVLGRVLRLWSPQVGFETSRDHVRWGGVVAGARCAITRDERNKITFYEASVPLSSIPELRPQRRGEINQTVRFTWIYHTGNAVVVPDDDDTMEDVSMQNSLEWSRVANVFPWWRNTGSLMPSKNLYLAAQVPIGFTLNTPMRNPAPTPTPRSPSSTRPSTGTQVLPPLPLPPSPDAQLPPAAPSIKSDPLPNLPPSPVQ